MPRLSFLSLRPNGSLIDDALDWSGRFDHFFGTLVSISFFCHRSPFDLTFRFAIGGATR